MYVCMACVYWVHAVCTVSSTSMLLVPMYYFFSYQYRYVYRFTVRHTAHTSKQALHFVCGLHCIITVIIILLIVLLPFNVKSIPKKNVFNVSVHILPFNLVLVCIYSPSI
jgi:hypothetical protein